MRTGDLLESSLKVAEREEWDKRAWEQHTRADSDGATKKTAILEPGRDYEFRRKCERE